MVGGGQILVVKMFEQVITQYPDEVFFKQFPKNILCIGRVSPKSLLRVG